MNIPIRGTCCSFKDETGKQYTHLLEVLWYYSDPLNFPSTITNNRVFELSTVCHKAYNVLKHCLADDLINIKTKLK